MRYKKILTWACTAALFLTGCTTDTVSNGRWMEDSNAVRIQASAGSTLTRSNPIETDESKLTGFNEGDMISVRNRNITVNYTLNGEIWQPVDNDKYLVWDKNDLKFEAYYPCDVNNTFSVGCIKKDQSTLEALAQSDYMNTTYNVPEVPSDKHLTLKLERKTARLIFKIQKFNDEFSERVKVDKLEIDCPEKTNGETDDWDPITPYRQNGDGGVGTTYTALVIPGVIYAKLYTSENSYDSEGEPQALNLETGTLEAGKSYTYNLIVGKNKVTVGGVTVAGWDTGYTLPEGVAEELAPYVTMTANSKQTFVMKCAGSYTLPDLEYSVNNGTWQKVVANQGVDFGGNLGSLCLRGKCPNGTATSWEKYSTITFSDENVKVDCSGDIRTLIDYTAYDGVATENSSFISLFQNCTALKSAPQLPAKALKESCYRQMFEGCTSLEQAPDLPATVLKQSCYQSMFTGCTALTKAPNLPATKLQNYCYQSMFSGCRALTQAPTLSAEELGWNCYSFMFESCTSLVNAPALPATTLKVRCYQGMFKNCTSLTEAPELKAMKMEASSYKFMFEDCTALVDAPKLPAKELDNYCYESMFKGCTSLQKAPELRAKKFMEGCYKSMFEDCKKLVSVTMLTTEYASTPLYGWLKNAGTEAENRTLKVYNWEAYKNIKTNIPDIWQIGKCTVWDKDGNKITTTE